MGMMCAMIGWRVDSAPRTIIRNSRIRREKDLQRRCGRIALSDIESETLSIRTQVRFAGRSRFNHVKARLPRSRRQSLIVADEQTAPWLLLGPHQGCTELEGIARANRKSVQLLRGEAPNGIAGLNFPPGQ